MKEIKKPRCIKNLFAAVMTALMITTTAIAASAESGYVNTQTTGLNVRNGAGLTYSVTTSLPKGSSFQILSEVGGWTKIQAGEVTGYVSSDYVGRYAQTAVAPAQNYPAVNAAAPYYTQYDSRWANVKLGAYGETIRGIGCTTTAVAMSESCRTKSIITPANIAYTYSYTPGGALYWPSHYTQYSSSDWMKYTYAQLASGKPVIIHCRTYSGGTHWVLIYGYTGGEKLTADNFLIRDPASETRTTLAQYMAKFPVFVKLVHYT